MDEIEALVERARNDLDDLLHFGSNNRFIWWNFKVWVRRGTTFKTRNMTTGKTFTETDLIDLYPHYNRTYLLSFSLVQLITIFEAFLFDFIRLLLMRDPRHLAQKKQIEVGFAISAPDREALISLIAEREINELKYGRPKAWFEYLDRIVKLDCPTPDEIAQFAEMKAARDLIIHNGGVVNAVYIDKAGPKARYAVDQKITVSQLYFVDSWTLAKKLIDDLTGAVSRRMSQGDSA